MHLNSNSGAAAFFIFCNCRAIVNTQGMFFSSWWLQICEDTVFHVVLLETHRCFCYSFDRKNVLYNQKYLEDIKVTNRSQYILISKICWKYSSKTLMTNFPSAHLALKIQVLFAKIWDIHVLTLCCLSARVSRIFSCMDYMTNSFVVSHWCEQLMTWKGSILKYLPLLKKWQRLIARRRRYDSKFGTFKLWTLCVPILLKHSY